MSDTEAESPPPSPPPVSSIAFNTRARGPPPLAVPHIAPGRTVRRNPAGNVSLSDLERVVSSSSSHFTGYNNPSSWGGLLSYLRPTAAAPPVAPPTDPSAGPSQGPPLVPPQDPLANWNLFGPDEGDLEGASASGDTDAPSYYARGLFDSSSSDDDSDASVVIVPTMADPFIAFRKTLRGLDYRTKRYDNAITAHNDGSRPLTPQDAQVQLDDLKELGKDITALQSLVFQDFSSVKASSTDPASPLDMAMAEFDPLHDLFVSVRKATMDLAKILEPVTGTGLKPPKLSLPQFKGIHGEWPSFKSAFTALVNDSTKFSPCEKLRLLKDALKGPAADNLSDLQSTDGNWPIAWDRLTARYDSPREAAHAAVKPLLDLPSLMSQTGNGIHKLLATVRTTRAQIALIKLGTVTEAEVLYSHFILARLDARTIKEFNQSLTTNDVPALDTIINWLERQAKSIDLTNEIKQTTPPKQGEQRNGQQRRDQPPALAIQDQKVRFHPQSPQQKPRGRSPGSSGRSSSHQQRRDNQNNQGPRQGSPHPQRDRSKSPRGSSGQSPRGQRTQSQGTLFPCAVCGSQHHKTHRCPELLGYSINARKDWIRSNNRCYNCLGTHAVKDCTSTFTCSHCKKRHHTLLHYGDPVTHVTTIFSSVPNQVDHDEDFTIGILPTAVVRAYYQGGSMTARCLLDSGAEKCFITSRAAEILGLPIYGSVQKFTVAGGKTIPSLGYTTFTITGARSGSACFRVRASILPQITTSIPAYPLDTSKWTHIKYLPLADSTYNQPGEIDILLGTTMMDLIMRGKKIEGLPGTPSAYLTEFGYVVQGRIDATPTLTVNTCPSDTVSDADKPTFQMEQFWKIEDLPAKTFLTTEEQACEDHFVAHTKLLDNGRFQVQWPFQKSPHLLGTSFQSARRRWMAMERKLQADPELALDYHGQIEDYIKQGHLEPIPTRDQFKNPHYWIPHHAVFKASSTTTKMRIVFDASAKSSSGYSLNALLPPGPTIQAPLFDQLLRFRHKNIAMTADIAQMYRQISLDPSDRNLARIIWRKKPSDALQYLRHTTPFFGCTSSPWLAVRAINELAKRNIDKFPLAAKAALESLYIDDLLHSADGLQNAIQMVDELIQMLASGGMELRKWSSNSPVLMSQIPPHLHENTMLDIDPSATVGTLGMRWNPISDPFQYMVTLPQRDTHTKRSVLSDISKLFDPLGLLAPTVIAAKIFMQRVWNHEIGWDDTLPASLLDQWLEYYHALPQLEEITIPRWTGYTTGCDWELHGFCDASELAYCAAVYLRSKVGDDIIRCELVASKTRVAPVKVTTIPRLELQGAVLLVDLMSHIRQQYQIDNSNVHYWTDSTICLHWIYSHPSKWKIYVANRVNQIQILSSANQWAHVISEENPADCGSRGLTPSELRDFNLWWNGPTWLAGDYTKPVFDPSASGYDGCKSETKPVALALVSAPDYSVIVALARISSWTKAIRVLVLLHSIGQRKSFRKNSPLPYASKALAFAETSLVRLIQEIAYPDLDTAIAQNFRTSRFEQYRCFRTLNPYQDKDGVFRVGGRLQRTDLAHAAKHPALLPSSHPLVRAYILHVHHQLAHAGRMSVHNHIRQKFWIPNALKSIKAIIHSCLLCYRYLAKGTSQLMGQLPAARVNITRPFQHTGVDFFGPYELKNFTGRGGKFKVWVSLFTCLATRALHLEIVSSLSQFGFLLAFRRFIARRGKPSHMYSDNGTNFVGANHHLIDVRTRHLTTKGLTQAILPDLDLDQIVWKFNPPATPHTRMRKVLW